MVSIIILNYNNLKYTNNCIKSILQQTHRYEIEIIVVDNASTIGNPNELKVHFPEIKLVRNTYNRGFAGAVTMAFYTPKENIFYCLTTILYC